jgi:hypothetical protein
MTYAIKADMNGEILAGELIKTAGKLPDDFNVTPNYDIGGNLQSGEFTLTPTNNLGIDGLYGRTYVDPAFPFELQISVEAFHWPEDNENAKAKALLSIFKPLVDSHNQTHASKADLVQKS